MPIRIPSTVMRSEFQHPEILDWFDRRTFGPSNPGPFMPDPGLLAEVKRESGLRVSVCLPALNEQTTGGWTEPRVRMGRDLMPRENRPLAVRFDQEIIERPAMANTFLQT